MSLVTAYQSVPAVCGQWNQVAEYRPSRKSLMVQCPQSAKVVEYTSFAPAVNTTTVMLAANPLRQAFTLAATADFWIIATVETELTNGLYTLGITVPQQGIIAGLYNAMTISDPAMASQEWFCQRQGIGVSPLAVWETILTTASIVMGVNTGVDEQVSDFGDAPVGFWQSPNLAAGGAIFTLDLEQHGDIVRQAWYAWPIGTGEVEIPVLECFDAPDLGSTPPDMYAEFQVGLPQLGPHGRQALKDLLAKIGGKS